MSLENIFYYKRGYYMNADEIVKALVGISIEEISFIVIKEKYSGRVIEYNLIEPLNREVNYEIISLNKQKQELSYQSRMIPQFLNEKIIVVNAKLARIQNELGDVYKQRLESFGITKSNLLKNVGNSTSTQSSQVIELDSVVKKNIDTGFVERSGVNKFCVLFFNGDGYSFLENRKIFNKNPLLETNGFDEFTKDIVFRRKNFEGILKEKIIEN